MKLGLLFGETITKKKGSARRFEREEKSSSAWLFFLLLLLLATIVLFARLVDLQIIKGSYFKSLAEGNRIRKIPIKAARGQIFDKNGKPLALNRPVYKLATFTKGGVVSGAEEISREEALTIQSEQAPAAASLLVDAGREYPKGEYAAHVIGFVNEVGQEEVGSVACGGKTKYELTDVAGRMGIEAFYDCTLRGINGQEIIEVDSQGGLIRKLGRKEPVPGTDLQLSIDSKLTEVASRALKGRKGAVIAQDPDTGEVLALVSSPSFNPNELTKNYDKLSSDPDLPLFNRAISGVYPPGSTYKIVTAGAGLEEGVVDENWEYEDVGLVQVGAFTFRNWYYTQYGRTEGKINIVRAIGRSTDTFFYKLGELIGPDRLAAWSKRFGLGQPVGIDLPGEAKGLIPDPEWKLRVKQERWFLGNTYNTSIGQGDITTTPLQVNVMTSVIASGGKLCRPSLADKEGEECQKLGLKDKTIQLVKEGMVTACSPGGTAFPLFSFDPQVACKTGTAEFGNKEETHAWLTAFAPVDNPEIAVTVLIEGGGEGSRVAAPVVKEVLEYWFHQDEEISPIVKEEGEGE